MDSLLQACNRNVVAFYVIVVRHWCCSFHKNLCTCPSTCRMFTKYINIFQHVIFSRQLFLAFVSGFLTWVMLLFAIVTLPFNCSSHLSCDLHFLIWDGFRFNSFAISTSAFSPLLAFYILNDLSQSGLRCLPIYISPATSRLNFIFPWFHSLL